MDRNDSIGPGGFLVAFVAGAAVGAAVAHEGAGAIGLRRMLGLARRHHRQTPGLENQIV